MAMSGMKRWERCGCLILLLGALASCVSAPKNVAPVENFALSRYLGKWYEIARLDHSFERGLQRVTADYSLRDDGGVKVINRGFNSADDAWEEAEGKAYFVEGSSTGYLKVSFFGPFYGAYVVFEVGEDYDYAFVSGPNKDYLWLLAREPQVSPELYSHFVERARELGFDTDELIRVQH